MITASFNWNSASVVAIFPQIMQKPFAFFVLLDAGLVSNGFTTVRSGQSSVYTYQHITGAVNP